MKEAKEKVDLQGAPGTGGEPPKKSLTPALTLPKGGGAIRGIDEKFETNPTTGTGSLSVAIATSPGRGGFGPDLALRYDSGAGSGPFGVGWSLSPPSITRKTDKGLPRYADSDVFVLAGSEDLVPARTASGDLDEHIAGGHRVLRWLPRVEASFARIEQWTEIATGEVHWRVTTRENLLHVFGRTANARIADPKHADHVFAWLLEETHDDRGSCARYVYKAEDGAGVDPGRASESNRFRPTRDASPSFTATSQRYLKRVLYGNRTPIADREAPAPDAAAAYHFEIVFDYGEHDPAAPTPSEAAPWPVRRDPFSTYRATFEVRTYRLCRRVLVFHRFAELGSSPCLVRSTDLEYDESEGITYLVSVTHAGYVREAATGRYERATHPPLELGYARAVVRDELRTLDHESLEGIPGDVMHWVDLDGEGLPGALVTTARAWFYKRNRGGGRFDPPHVLRTLPSPAELGGVQQLTDLGGDGALDLVQYAPPLAGYFERTADEGWAPLVALTELPNVDWKDPALRFVDLDGDGLPDLLVTEHDAFVFHRSRGKDGFEPAARIAKPDDELDGPAIVFADGTETIHLADMSGDGLVDIVRVRRSEVCYWPNLGYGRFGRKVTLDGVEAFDTLEGFDPRRVRFADVDGSGTSDIAYLGVDGVTLYFNRAGNALSRGARLGSLPAVDPLAHVDVVDLLGQGTACLVWSSKGPGHEGRPVAYVDLMGSQKPHVLTSIVNNVGAETHIQYAASTKFYLRDRAEGRPWLTRLPFPVHVVERVERVDHVAETRLVSRRAYHHGYFDGHERELRGFACVEQWDAESFSGARGRGAIADQDVLQRPPVRTVTWFHTGAWLERERLERALAREFYDRDGDAPLLPSSSVPRGLSTSEEREALRALRGQVLRQEVYAEDGSDAAVHPYSVAQHDYELRLLQHGADGSHAVFFVAPRSAVTLHYERRPEDPRTVQELVLDVDDFGNVTSTASIAYPRRRPEEPEQARLWATLAETDLANVTAGGLRLGVPLEERRWELTGLERSGSALFSIEDVRRAASRARPIPHEAKAPPGLAKRLLGAARTRYYDSGALPAALPFGQVDARAIAYETYELALTKGVLAEAFGDEGVDHVLDEGGYVRLDEDGSWWIPSGRAVPDPTRFFLATETVDPFGNRTRVGYDGYALLTERVEDALGNVIRADNDYRVLGPTTITDPNGNREAVAIDALGMVVATAVMGKAGADEGDTLDDPTTEVTYDLSRWKRSGGKLPCFVRTRTRERHGPGNTRWQESYTYSDGSGRVAMTKARAEPGPAPLRRDGRLVLDANGAIVVEHVAERWVGSGKVVVDDKGSPVKEYEPFFSSTPEYEGEDELRRWGVTAVSFYDPPGRLVRVELPHGGIRRTQRTPWDETTFDENDTVADAENRWLATRRPDAVPAPRAEEQRAARLSLAHADTPATTKLDALGRAFLAIERLDASEDGARVATRTELCADGRPVAIIDALGRECARYVRGLDGQVLREVSIDAGQRAQLNDVAGAALRSWDAVGHRVRTTYDALRRPTHLHVKKGAGPERLLVRTIYGEGRSDPEARNLRGRAAYVFDQAGAFENEAFDFRGNLVASARRLAVSYAEVPDWSALEDGDACGDVLERAAAMLEADRFAKRFAYDALGRVTSATLPDASEVLPRYNEAGFLEALDVRVRGADAATTFVSNIDYDAKGRRTRIVYGNGTSTSYGYDPLTFRLTHLETTRARDGAVLQDLRYTYDCAGNVVATADRAQQTVFFAGEVVSASSEYEYDALYRLIRATGREHRGAGGPPGPEDVALHELPHPNDVQALRRYEERFTYDGVGNLLDLVHDAGAGSWTRRYAYVAGTNRLRATSAPGDAREGPCSARYEHDESGNMTALPGIAAAAYSHAGQMVRADLGGGGTAHYVYDAAGLRVRKVAVRSGLVEEHVYLGGFEIHRKRDASGLLFERQTLHVMDDARRIAMVETKTADAKVPSSTGAPRVRYQYDDHLGSAILECDDEGRAISYEELHPFGTSAYRSARSGLDVSEKRYRYTGKERDEETGLYYHGARYYAPWVGRWTSADPAGMADGPNLYAYVQGRVLNAVDPDGRQSIFTVGVVQSPAGRPRTAADPPPEPPPPDALEQAAKLHGQTVGRIQTLEREIVELNESYQKRAPIRFWSLEHFFAASGFPDPILERGQQLGELVEAGVAEEGTQHWESSVLLRAIESGIITNQAEHDRFLQIAESERKSVVLRWAAWRAFEMVLALTPVKGGGAGGMLFARAPQSTSAALGALNKAAQASGVTGRWVNVVESMSARAIKFQELVTGGVRAGTSFLRNGVKFDAIDTARKVLVDAKGPGYATFVGKDGKFFKWFEGAQALVEQANRQKAAAKGMPIEWVFAEEKAMKATERLLANEKITGITLRLR